MKIILCCLLSVFLVGCSTLSSGAKSDTSGMLEPQATLKFSDIPVPVGLKPLTQDSYSFETSGVRVAVLKYRGKADADRIIGFYKEQMAMYNWDLINIIEYGQRLMNFEHENESCIITLQPAGWGDSIVTISLGPKSQNLAKKSRQPIK